MLWYGKNKILRPVRQFTQLVNGQPCRCAVFCMNVKDTPALLRWMELQAAPVLGLYRSESGTVTVYLGAAPKEETNG